MSNPSGKSPPSQKSPAELGRYLASEYHRIENDERTPEEKGLHLPPMREEARARLWAKNEARGRK